MTECLIAFNDEWVQEHTAEQLREKATAARVVVDEMPADDVLTVLDRPREGHRFRGLGQARRNGSGEQI